MRYSTTTFGLSIVFCHEVQNRYFETQNERPSSQTYVRGDSLAPIDTLLWENGAQTAELYRTKMTMEFLREDVEKFAKQIDKEWLKSFLGCCDCPDVLLWESANLEGQLTLTCHSCGYSKPLTEALSRNMGVE